MEIRGQTNRVEGDTGPTIMHDLESMGGEIPVVPGINKGSVQFDVNSYLRHLARVFSPSLKGRAGLHPALGSGVILVRGIPAQIMTVFATLITCANQLAPGGSMTIISTLLPLDIGLPSKRMGNGCALLSFCLAGAKGERIANFQDLGRNGLLRALFNVKTIVEKHHGCFRLSAREAKITFNIYLPVVQSVPLTHGMSATEAFRGKKEWI